MIQHGQTISRLVGLLVDCYQTISQLNKLLAVLGSDWSIIRVSVKKYFRCWHIDLVQAKGKESWTDCSLRYHRSQSCEIKVYFNSEITTVKNHKSAKKIIFYNSDPSTLFVVRYEDDFNNDWTIEFRVCNYAFSAKIKL